MDKKDIISYYSRKDVQEAILACSKDREVGVMLGSIFGKRPDVLEYPADVGKLGKQGATSFHISEERWSDALALKPGMTKRQLDENRKGWDLLIDIDTAFWDYAKWTAYFVAEAFKFHNIKNYAVKFSGNKGFHIGVPFEAFPDEVHGIKTKDLYPESLRVIAAYLQEIIKDHLAARILENESIMDIAKKAGKMVEELLKDGKFDPFSIVEIDTVLISNRHLFRAPYSLHEKSGLASIPIKPDEILSFDKAMARPENVDTTLRFLDMVDTGNNEARSLVIQAFDWHARKNRRIIDEIKIKQNKYIELPKIAIPEIYFPPCIKKILMGNMEDGKKRSLFILIKFLRHVGWDWKSIEERIKKWNGSNPETLREAYVQGQITYAKRSKETGMAPNCGNPGYYKDLRICNMLPLCSKIKNPINFAKIKARTNHKIVKRPKGRA